jgi:two-component system OmpR family sensor kinase
MILNSIRWRLQLWYGMILVLVLAGFGFAAYQLEYNRQFRRIDDDLQRHVTQLADSLRPHPDGPRNRPFDGRRGPGMDGPGMEAPGMDGPPPEHRDGHDRPGEGRGTPFDISQLHRLSPGLFDESDTNGFYYVLWGRENEEIARSANAPAVPRPEPAGAGSGPRPSRTRGPFRETFVITPPGDIFLAGRSIAPELNDLRLTAWTLLGAGGVILLLGLAGGGWLVSRAIRPIKNISAAAEKISAGDLSQRIDVAETESELGRLAAVLNSTFARLESAFAQQRQFTSDAAHELRTPVSVLLTQTQTALNRERSAGEYRETIETCRRTAQRMRGLIESLLELARFDAGQVTLKRSPFDLARTAADCVALVQPLAETRRITIETEGTSANCHGDSERIAQVITNLLTNAIHYNKDEGSVRIMTRSENGFAVLTVSDTGAGIAPEHLPQLFKRFYRADTARTTSHGRTGLGLAISKAIVDAHGGTIEIASKLDEGTTFTVRLPD